MGSEDGAKKPCTFRRFKPRAAEVALSMALLLGCIVMYRAFSGTVTSVVMISTKPENGVLRDQADIDKEMMREFDIAPQKLEYPEQEDGQPLGEINNDGKPVQDEKTREEMEMKEMEMLHKVISGEAGAAIESTSTEVPSLGGLLFKDAKEYNTSPNIDVLPYTDRQPKEYRGLWSLQKLHDQFFAENTHKRHIPHLDQPISRLQFHQTFRQTSTPVVIPFDHMRHLGFLTKAWTLDELREKFPYTPNGKTKLKYHARAGTAQNVELDFGPALYEIAQDAKLVKGQGSFRNFPRNLLIKAKYLAKLDVSHPPFVSRRRFQQPTLWMGTSTADTRLHSDCCDNFVMMLAGTKKWFIAPPSDSHHLKPVVCTGKHQSLCWASLKYPNKSPAEMTPRDAEMKNKLNAVEIELKAGEMLYLPAGWWHHIENLGPTVMVNFWTLGCENVHVALDNDPNRSDRSDFNNCPAVAQNTNEFISKM
mmetsp:Transcript_5840/g.9069  ORF Transcript_5840/g.9069 Transcript_5840/m.9069 type:complete len:477 (-) Transcript_5840:60-1490(-)